MVSAPRKAISPQPVGRRPIFPGGGRRRRASRAGLACALTAAVGLATAALPAQGPTSGEPAAWDSLEGLLNLRVDTATIRETPWINQPATLSVWRTSDAAMTGARTLGELLDFVPGMGQGVDVFGINGLTVRGQWAHEGKVLLLWDDLPLNDLLYGSLQLARHYPLAQIDRVEVIRGAGLAKYGGNAQLAVIRIHSQAPATSGFTWRSDAESMAGAGPGWQTTATGAWVTPACALTVGGHLGRLPYSGESWRDTGGRVWDLGDTTGIDTANGFLKLAWRDLRVSVLYDRHLAESPQKFGYGTLGEDVRFESWNASARYDFRLGEQWTITPRLAYRYQRDWFIRRDPGHTPTLNFYLPAWSGRAALETQAEFARVDFLAGLEYRQEGARAQSPGGPPGTRQAATYFGGREETDHEGAAAFAEADWRLDEWLVSVGTRWSHHSYAGDSVVPRASVSYSRPTWHVKGMAGQSFREPDLEVINSADPLADPVQPETTTQLEVEFGWRPAPGWLGTLAFFDLCTEDPIIYSSVANDYFYVNQEAVRTRGVEMDWRISREPLDVLLGYSFHELASDPIAAYAVPGQRHTLLGTPQHKVHAAVEWTLPLPGWRLYAAAVWHSATYGADHDPAASDALGNPLSIRRLTDRAFLNLGLRYARGPWSATLAVNDVSDTGRLLVQPSRSESTPYPGAGRTVWISLARSWP